MAAWGTPTSPSSSDCLLWPQCPRSGVAAPRRSGITFLGIFTFCGGDSVNTREWDLLPGPGTGQDWGPVGHRSSLMWLLSEYAENNCGKA